MEQPPGTSDDLQTPQDLPPVVDLSQRGDECDVVRRNSKWYQSTGQGCTGPPYPDTPPCTVPSGGQILPDNAFARTTVTLSYVSRSHVFSTQDSLCGHSEYGIPTFSKYSLQPSCGLGEMDIALNQPYLENVDGPSGDLAAHTSLLQSLSQAQMDLGIESNMKQTFELNGASQLDTSEHHMDNNCEHLQNGGELWFSESLHNVSACLPKCAESLQESECSSSLNKHMENSSDNHRIQNSPRITTEFSQATQCSAAKQDRSSVDCLQECPTSLPGFLELVSKECLEKSSQIYKNASTPLGECEDSLQECQEPESQEIVLDGDSLDGVLSTHHTQQDGTTHSLDDTVSSSVASLDDVFILPEASSLQSTDISFLGTTDDLSSAQETIAPGSDESTTSLLTNDADDKATGGKKPVLEPLIDLADVCMADVLKENLKNTKVLNGNGKALQKTICERKLPVRSGRGTRLEAIVMNINSSRYNVSGRIRAGKKSPQTKDDTLRPRKSARLSESKTKCDQTPKVSSKKGTITSSPDNCKKTTSDLHRQSTEKLRQTSPVKLKLSLSSDETSTSVNSQETASQVHGVLDVPAESVVSNLESSKSPTKSPRKMNMASTKKPHPTAKSNSKKKRKKTHMGNTSRMFSPKEPEIKLRYLNYKEKRDSKMNSFSPFIRVQRKQEAPSLCTVVNYLEEVKTPQKTNQQQGTSAPYVSGTIPTTSCLQLGRASMDADQQRVLVCCLCGQSANAIDLGDLHGPYYSEGHQPPAKRSNAGSGLKEEGSSDSDSSLSCSGGRKWRSIKRQQRGGEEGRSPAAKRARADAEDWYSPPLVPLGPCEYWIHEDCGVWAAGVFLVRGRVYGLEEAVRAAHSTRCSSCGDRGASLGCLFKGCPNKYHYRCALHSDCVLEEDNFSMKCRKHKNKSIKAPPGSRPDPS